MAAHRVVEVTWTDHAFHFGEYDPDDSGLSEVTSVGWLVHKDDTLVKVALSLVVDDPTLPTEFSEVQVIDRRLVKKLRYLT